MCQFGDESKIIKKHQILENEALIGWRNNIVTNPFNDEKKFLKALNNDYIYPKKELATGLGLESNNSLGIYNYNNYNYNNYYYNYNNYNYNNNNNNNYNNYNYNYYYNYNNYNYNYYNYNNNYNYYYIQVKTLHHGKIFEYSEGYRSEYCKITHLVILDKDSKWFSDKNTIKFANHFNSLVENLAKEYNCEVMEFSKRI